MRNATCWHGLRRILLAAWMAAAIPAAAHDFWIEPSSFTPRAGQVVDVQLRVGEDFAGDIVPRHAPWIEQFVVEDGTGRHAVPGQEGADPAGLLRVAGRGLLIIGYHGKPQAITLAPDKFNQYLQEEGLDAILALRAQRGVSSLAARERYARCAKSLLWAGRADGKQQDRRLGFPLELVAEKNPYRLRRHKALPLRLWFYGKPLAGAQVVAINRQRPAQKRLARTDAQGRVVLRLPQGGVWLINSVHMVEARADSDADWESYWASLTFERRPAQGQSGHAQRDQKTSASLATGRGGDKRP